MAANWRLYCPAGCDDATADDPDRAEQIRARRARAGVPDDVRHRERWRLALDMLDQMTADWGLPQLPVSADAGYGDATEFRLGLQQRGYRFVVAVKETTSAYPEAAQPALVTTNGRGRPPKPRYRDALASLRDLALATGRNACVTLTWRHGTRTTKRNPNAAMTSTLLTIKVRPAQPRHPPQP